MALSPGTRLGAYEILSLLGSGGMGEVYRARDTKLGRDVALKFLPDSFTHDPERVARFRREAQVLASLNHPHISAIYGFDEASGAQFLVLELVDGESLDKRIARGPIPVSEALDIARQIAEALDAAHERGIVHRDLNPANIKVREDGTVKVLDFGLAKTSETAIGATVDVTNSPTITSPVMMTSVGQILGTAAYMAPEQARGKGVDKRADIWAFGVILFEMLTGRRLFEAETISDTLVTVLKEEPDWNRLPTKAQRLLKSCLQKDPNLRLRDIGDAWRLLEDAPPTSMRDGRLWKIVAATLVVLSIVLGSALWRSASPGVATPQTSVRLDLDLGPDVILASTTGPSMTLSPDGARLVFVSQGADGIRRLFTRRLDESKVAQLSGSEGASAPFFSPDGQWVGFFAKGKLKKTRIEGGESVILCDAPQGRGGTWGTDGNIIAALNTLTGLSLLPSEGGPAGPLTELGPGEYTHRWPQVLPGGKAVLFSVSDAATNFDEADVVVFSLQDHRRKTVIKRAGMYPRYLPSGHLVYVNKGWLFAVPFDPDGLDVRGVPIMLAQVSNNKSIGFAQFDYARSGTLAYRLGETENLMTVAWLDGAGNTESLIAEAGTYHFPRLSPDGNRLAFTVNQGANTDLFVYDWQRGHKTRLTNAANASTDPVTLTGISNPVWSADSQFVVFRADGRLFWARADGVGKPQLLTDRTSGPTPMSLARDGTLAFSQLAPRGGAEIRTLQVESRSGQLRAVGESQVFLKTSTADVQAAFSPDGHWLAYADAIDGDYQVYVRAFPDRGLRVQVSSTVGMVPRWSATGHELFYRTEDQRIMVVNYAVRGESFTVDKPRVWSGKQLANTGTAPNYDLAPDGKRLLGLMPTASPEPRTTQSHVMITTNVFEEIRERVAEQGK